MGLPKVFFLTVVALAVVSSAAGAPGKTLTLLQTGDLHGHLESWLGWEGELRGKRVGGFDHLVAAIDEARKKAGADHVLLLDSGDTFGDTLLADLTKGSAVIQLMNRVRYDAMVLGNHEFDFGVTKLEARARQAGFSMLAANVLRESSGEPLVKPYMVRDVAGIRVGILGLGYPNTPLTTAKDNVAGLSFRDPILTAKQYLPELRKQGAELVIVLSHLGLGAETTLAEALPGIDVILGGHSHNRMKGALRVGSTLIVQSGAHGSDLGRLDLTIENGHIVSFKRTLILLDNAVIPSSAEVARELDALRKPYEDKLTERVGEMQSTLLRAQTLAGEEARKRNEESPADDLFADILREETGSDIALLPGVGYGVAVAKGPVVASALRNLIPHHSKVVTMTLSGAEVRQILEQAVENTFTDDSKLKVGGMVQVSGLNFEYDPRRSVGDRIVAATTGKSPLAKEKRYRVATNTLLAHGGHRYESFAGGKDKQERGEQYDMIKGWFLRRRVVESPALGRILEQK